MFQIIPTVLPGTRTALSVGHQAITFSSLIVMEDSNVGLTTIVLLGRFSPTTITTVRGRHTALPQSLVSQYWILLLLMTAH